MGDFLTFFGLGLFFFLSFAGLGLLIWLIDRTTR